MAKIEQTQVYPLKRLYTDKAKERHSDVGGADALMAELNVAYDEARQELKS